MSGAAPAEVGPSSPSPRSAPRPAARGRPPIFHTAAAGGRLPPSIPPPEVAPPSPGLLRSGPAELRQARGLREDGGWGVRGPGSPLLVSPGSCPAEAQATSPPALCQPLRPGALGPGRGRPRRGPAAGPREGAPPPPFSRDFAGAPLLHRGRSAPPPGVGGSGDSESAWRPRPRTRRPGTLRRGCRWTAGDRCAEFSALALAFGPKAGCEFPR